MLSVFPNTRKHTQQQEHIFFPIFHFPGSNPKLRPRLADLHLQRIDTTTTAFTFALFQPFTGDRDRPTSCTFTLSFLEQTRWIVASSSNKSGGAHWKGQHSQTRTWGTAKSTAPESEGCVTPELLITLETQHWCPSPHPPPITVSNTILCSILRYFISGPQELVATACVVSRDQVTCPSLLTACLPPNTLG